MLSFAFRQKPICLFQSTLYYGTRHPVYEVSKEEKVPENKKSVTRFSNIFYPFANKIRLVKAANLFASIINIYICYDLSEIYM